MEIIITVTDQNDNRHVFTKQVFIGYIEENAKPGVWGTGKLGAPRLGLHRALSQSCAGVSGGVCATSEISVACPRAQAHL